jgi:DNA-binding GntR family transcriptional regulator
MFDNAVAVRAPARQTLGDGVAELIRDAIFRGTFKPGQRLPEAKIAASLRVSRAPVRDALVGLEQEGIVHRMASGGTVVATLSKHDVEEICSLRQPLEVLAAQRAGRLGAADDWERLAAIIRSTENAQSAEELTGLDLQFHEAIVRAARHGRLLADWLRLASQIRLVMIARNIRDDDSRRGTVEMHAELLAALRARNEAAAVAMIEQGLQAQYEWVIHNFD